MDVYLGSGDLVRMGQLVGELSVNYTVSWGAECELHGCGGWVWKGRLSRELS